MVGCWCWVVNRGRFVSWCRSIFGFTRVLNISNISRVVISNSVGDSLGAAIRKKDIVLAIGSISITSFIVSKVNTRVIISYSIGIVIVGRSFIGRCRFVSRCRFVDRCRSVSRGMVNRYMVNWGMVNRGMVNTSMVNRGMVHRGMMNRGNGMVHRCMSSKLEV